ALPQDAKAPAAAPGRARAPLDRIGAPPVNPGTRGRRRRAAQGGSFTMGLAKWIVGACAALTLAGCSEREPAGGIDAARLMNAAADVGGPGRAWFSALDAAGCREGAPLVIDGRSYITAAWSKVKAYGAAAGEMLWQYEPGVPTEIAPQACCDVVNRGVAAWGD